MEYGLYYLALELQCSINVIDAIWQCLPMRCKVDVHMGILFREIVDGMAFHEDTSIRGKFSSGQPSFRISNFELHYTFVMGYAFGQDGVAIYRHQETYELITRKEWIDNFRLYAQRVHWIESLIILLQHRGWVAEDDGFYDRMTNKKKSYTIEMNFNSTIVSIETRSENGLRGLCYKYSETTGYAIVDKGIRIHRRSVTKGEWWVLLQNIL